MLNIKNTLSFAAIVCGLLIIFSTSQNASAQFVPPGSYQKSCKNISVNGAALNANCNPNGFSDAKHKNAEDFFVDYLNSPGKADNKALIIDNAFKEVYSTGVSPQNMAFYNAQKISYADIIKAEKKKLKADKVLNRLAVAAAFQKTMGRPPVEKEYGIYTLFGNGFKEKVESLREYLYKSGGAKDLTETVKHYLADRRNDKPTIEQINAVIIKFSKSKAIYDEMK